MFVIPPLLLLLPKGWDTTISPYLPDASGRAIFAVGHNSDLLGPWTGFAVFCAWAAGTLAVAAVLAPPPRRLTRLPARPGLTA